MTLELAVAPDTYEVLRLDPGAPVPAWFAGPGLRALLESEDELTLVLAEGRRPADWEAPREGGFRALRVVGTLEFSMVGVLAGLAGTLADAGISILALSTFDTDWLLVPGVRLDDARAALEAGGYGVRG